MPEFAFPLSALEEDSIRFDGVMYVNDGKGDIPVEWKAENPEAVMQDFKRRAEEINEIDREFYSLYRRMFFLIQREGELSEEMCSSLEQREKIIVRIITAKIFPYSLRYEKGKILIENIEFSKAEILAAMRLRVRVSSSCISIETLGSLALGDFKKNSDADRKAAGLFRELTSGLFGELTR